MAVIKWARGNQTDYTAIVSKDADTLYVTPDKGNLYLGGTTIVEKKEVLQESDMDGATMEAALGIQVPTAKSVIQYVKTKFAGVANGVEYMGSIMSADVPNLNATQAVEIGNLYLIKDSGTVGSTELTPGDYILFNKTVAMSSSVKVTDTDFDIIDRTDVVNALDPDTPSTSKATSEKAVVDALSWGTF